MEAKHLRRFESLLEGAALGLYTPLITRLYTKIDLPSWPKQPWRELLQGSQFDQLERVEAKHTVVLEKFDLS